MRKLDKAIITAYDKRHYDNGAELFRIASFMRFRWGMTHGEIQARFNYLTNMGLAEFDEILRDNE